MLLYLIIITALAYMVGGIPVGVIIAGIHKVNIHEKGSGKMGTTNVLRSVGRRAAALVLLGDFLKGSLAVLLARLLAVFFTAGAGTAAFFGFPIRVVTLASVLAAAAAVAGHVWSVYLRVLQGKWRGGRGVATALGAMLVINPLILLVALVVGITTIYISRYVSLGAIMGAVAAGLAIVLLVSVGEMDPLALLFVFLSIFIIAAHRDNIDRLLNGTERKIGERIA